MNIVLFLLSFYIVSQDACKSRATIYDQGVKSVLSVF